MKKLFIAGISMLALFSLQPIQARPNHPTPVKKTESTRRFSNYLYTTSDRCGFWFGNSVRLKNNDASRGYLVTIRADWRSGIQSGSQQWVVYNYAGGDVYIGCTQNGPSPGAGIPTDWTFTVVGEQ
ncbi:MAG TPA: hypothetical protein VM802_16520 [Chitinophaga sp.]|uniref:hypothetical protein n=1 Tax=Chitinophaga sp. TaxID=1869181 RepID=UPI002B75BBA6|nr:hypothetical protein [Chitinophaga sp.]HVI46482.1 hypothetical protein [Chitinophaga sp.]